MTDVSGAFYYILNENDFIEIILLKVNFCERYLLKKCLKMIEIMKNKQQYAQKIKREAYKMFKHEKAY